MKLSQNPILRDVNIQYVIDSVLDLCAEYMSVKEKREIDGDWYALSEEQILTIIDFLIGAHLMRKEQQNNITVFLSILT